MERRRRTRQTDDEVIIYDPVEEEMKEKEAKETNREPRPQRCETF